MVLNFTLKSLKQSEEEEEDVLEHSSDLLHAALCSIIDKGLQDNNGLLHSFPSNKLKSNLLYLMGSRVGPTNDLVDCG